MATLSPKEIALLISDNVATHGRWGNEPDEKFYDTAVAIALAESGGNTRAKNPSSSASGLFQIMVSAHRDKIGSRDIFDPAVNIDVARQVYQAAGGWTPWAVYNSGAYRQHLGKITDRSLLSKIASAPADAVNKIASGPAKIAAGVTSDIMSWLNKVGMTIGAAILALVLFSIGMWLLISNTKTGKTVGEAGKSAALMAATKGVVK